jgi:hypothetical protein
MSTRKRRSRCSTGFCASSHNSRRVGQCTIWLSAIRIADGLGNPLANPERCACTALCQQARCRARSLSGDEALPLGQISQTTGQSGPLRLSAKVELLRRFQSRHAFADCGGLKFQRRSRGSHAASLAYRDEETRSTRPRATPTARSRLTVSKSPRRRRTEHAAMLVSASKETAPGVSRSARWPKPSLWSGVRPMLRCLPSMPSGVGKLRGPSMGADHNRLDALRRLAKDRAATPNGMLRNWDDWRRW